VIEWLSEVNGSDNYAIIFDLISKTGIFHDHFLSEIDLIFNTPDLHKKLLF